MSSFQWSASQQVIERLLEVRGDRQRQKLLDFFDNLAVEPIERSEGQFQDEEGKIFLLTTFERWLITYHVDHAVKQVNLLALEH